MSKFTHYHREIMRIKLLKSLLTFVLGHDEDYENKIEQKVKKLIVSKSLILKLVFILQFYQEWELEKIIVIYC